MSLPTVGRALVGTVIWFTGFQCGSTNGYHHKDNNNHSITHQNIHQYGITWSYLIHCLTHSLITQLHLHQKNQPKIKSRPVGSRQFLDFLGNIFIPCSSPSPPPLSPTLPFLPHPLPGQEILQRILCKSKLLLCVSECVSLL